MKGQTRLLTLLSPGASSKPSGVTAMAQLRGLPGPGVSPLPSGLLSGKLAAVNLKDYKETREER